MENTFTRRVTGYRIVCRNKISILIEYIEIRIRPNKFEMFVTIILKNVLF